MFQFRQRSPISPTRTSEFADDPPDVIHTATKICLVRLNGRNKRIPYQSRSSLSSTGCQERQTLMNTTGVGKQKRSETSYAYPHSGAVGGAGLHLMGPCVERSRHQSRTTSCEHYSDRCVYL
jgi:hypothetical protein